MALVTSRNEDGDKYKKKLFICMSKNNGFARVARRHSRHQSLGSYVCA